MYYMIALSTLAATGKSVIFKKIGVESKSAKQLLASNAFSFFVAAVLSVIFSVLQNDNPLRISVFSFTMSVLFALCIIFTYLTQMKALSVGNASSTMLIYSCGFLVPIVFGAIVYNESISLIQLLSLILLTAALVLIINPQKDKKPSVAWIVFSFLSALGSGMIAVLQKIHQHSQYADEFTELLSWEFVIAGAALTAITVCLHKEGATKALSKRQAGISLLNGMFLCVLNTLNIQLAGKLPAVIVFPTYNIGSIILSGIVCAVLFHENITKKELVGFMIGCVAILCIGLF